MKTLQIGIVLGLFLSSSMLVVLTPPVLAQTSTESTISAEIDSISTRSAQQSSPREDITLPPQNREENTTEQAPKTGLSLVAEELPESFSLVQPLRWSLRQAVDRGVPANILVLLILFPMTAALVALFRHVIGLEGFGIYTPAAMAIAFVSMGFIRGLFLFAIVLISTTIGRAWVQTLKLQYLPRASLVLWFVSLIMLGVMVVSPFIPISNLSAVGIFPLLILVLLGEQFMSVQGSLNLRRAIEMTIETIILASISALLLRTFQVQAFVLRLPELALLLTLGVNLLVGKYTGLRLTEMFRFHSLLDQEE